MTADFWQRVGSGAERLSRTEDRFVWEARAEGHDWPAIAEQILEARAETSLARSRAASHRHALRWRREYRSEKFA